MFKTVLPPDIAFLRHSGFSEAALSQIASDAAALAVYPHEQVLANGLMAENDYYAALAKAYAITFTGDTRGFCPLQAAKDEEIGLACRAGILRALWLDRVVYLSAPYGRDLQALFARIEETPGLRSRLVLTPPFAFRKLLLTKNAGPLLSHSVNRLRRAQPKASAQRSYGSFFGVLAIILVAVILSVLYRAPLFAPLFGAVCALLYLMACYLRILSYGDYLEWRSQRFPDLTEAQLPVYSVLIPIYNEARLVPQLLNAAQRIDYPRAKLDVIFLIEQDDPATLKALQFARIPPYCRVIAVPEGQPRTKPRALQVGLSFARGSMVTIFDAEDIPHPLQLRHAARELAAGGPELACVQAQLRIDNPGASWLAKQFALEYAALFNVFMPSQAKRNFPMMLGGTSNYFRTHVLREIGGWDPWNVAEDADLGVRIARAGYRTATLMTPTEEEAPATLRNWLRQRMRWQKGWMQTLVVHFSQFPELKKELGLRNLLALIATLGVSQLSALSYPVVLLWVALDILFDLREYGINMLGAIVFGASVAAFIGGNLLPILHLQAGARRAGLVFDSFSVVTVWIYWLLISVSAYCALYDLARSPYRWLKTEHEGRVRKSKRGFNLARIFSPAPAALRVSAANDSTRLTVRYADQKLVS